MCVCISYHAEFHGNMKRVFLVLGLPKHNENFEMNVGNKYLLLIMFQKYLHLHSQDMKN